MPNIIIASDVFNNTIVQEEENSLIFWTKNLRRRNKILHRFSFDSPVDNLRTFL